MNRLPAIVIPIYRPNITDLEAISLAQLERHLSRYPRIVVCPESCDVPVEFRHFNIVRFPDAFFRSIESYNTLLLSDQFYRAFTEYGYILIYQLDCLVFRDALMEWCDRGYDYVGAPWETAQIRRTSQVGNGGLSLRRVEKFREILCSGRLSANLRLNLKWPSRFATPVVDHLARVARLVTSNSINHHIERTTVNEDVFWSCYARRFTRAFSVPVPAEAAAFSIETRPEYWFTVIGRSLPFGCHAWNRYGYEFWSSHLRNQN